MKEKLTYKRMLIVFYMLVTLVLTSILANVQVEASNVLKIRYQGKTRNYSGAQLSVNLDGKAVNLKSMPGLALKNAASDTIYLVSVADVFEKACGIKYTYNKNTKRIVLQKYGISVRMTLNKKTAYVNGKKTTLEYPPMFVKYYNTNKTRLLVPAKFVATTFGYSYSYTKLSSSSVRINMTSPDYIKYDGKWKKYTGTRAKLTFDGTDVNVSDMNCLVINKVFYVQAKAFAKSEIGGKCSYKSSTKKLTLTYGDNKLEMTIDSNTAYVNGKAVKASAPAKRVYNSKNETTYVMVPISYVAGKLGLNYRYVEKSKTCTLSRKDGIYFKWSAPENEIEIPVTQTDENDEGVLEPEEDLITDFAVNGVIGERVSNNDVVTIDGIFPSDNISISESSSVITIEIMDTKSNVGEESITLSQPYLLKKVTLTTRSDGTTVIKITKKSKNCNYTFSDEDGFISVTLTTGAVKNGYKIAVDTGHGAYTAGKRTPPILESLDFDGDGVIDAAKGSQIREHTANVGVGNYTVAALERCGFEVYKSGFGTTDTPLTTRQENIKAAKCDYSISIHFNAVGNGTSFNSAKGIEVFSHATSSKAANSKALATTVIKNVSKGTSQSNRGVNTQHTFAMCNASAMGTKGSILLECAFMTNWTEVKNMMANSAYWEETGEEIAKGFCEYLGVTYVAP